MTVYSIAVNAARIQNLLFIATEKLKVFWSKAVTAATLVQVAATGYLTGSVRAANLAMKALFATLKLNPYIALGVAVAALTIGIYKMITANKQVNQSAQSQLNIQKKTTEAYEKQAANVDLLVAKIKNENLSNQDRIAALNQLKAIIPEYNGMINQEGKLINDNKTAIDNYLVALEKQIKMKAAQEEWEELIRKKRIQQKAADKAREEANRYKGFANNSTYGASTGGAAVQGKLKALEAEAKNAENALNGTVSAINELEKELKSSTVSKPVVSGPKVGDVSNINGVAHRWDGKKWVKITTTDPGGQSTYKKAEEALENNLKIELLAYQEFYRQSLISERVYNAMSEMINIEFLERKIELQKKFKENTIDTETALSNARIKAQQQQLKDEEDHAKALESFKRLQAVDISEENPIIDTENYTMALRLAILKAFHEKGLLSEKEYNQKVADLTQENWEELYGKSYKFAGEINKVASAASQIMANIIESETIAVDNKYAAQIKAAKKAGKDTTALEEQVEKEKKEIKKKYADVDFAITVAKIISETAMAVMEAAPILPLQILMGALGASQLVLANQQRQAVKNLWTGGFTEPGDKYDPRGIVHAGEFVANQESVNNPQIRPVLDALDMAQRQGTASTLTADKLTRSMRTSNSYSEGGYVTGRSTAGSTSTSTNDELIRRQIAAIDRLSDLLEDGIQAEVIMSGDRGLSKQLDRYNNLVKNVSRG